ARNQRDRLRRRRRRNGPIPSRRVVKGTSGIRRNAQRPRRGRVRSELASERTAAITQAFVGCGSPPVRGGLPLAVGDFPLVGGGFPLVGSDFPPNGGNLPLCGGQSSPHGGQTAAHEGQTGSHEGQTAPREGETAPRRGSDSGRSPAALLFHQLLQADVDDQPEPERLQEVEDEAVPAVEDAQKDEVPIEEIERGTGEQRHPAVTVLQPQDSLVGGPEEARRRLPGQLALAPLQLLAREGLGISKVLLEVELDRILLEVPLLQGRPQPSHGAADVDPRILLDGVQLRAAAAEQLEQDLAAVTPEADGLAAEDLAAADVVAVLLHVGPRQKRRDL